MITAETRRIRADAERLSRRLLEKENTESHDDVETTLNELRETLTRVKMEGKYLLDVMEKESDEESAWRREMERIAEARVRSALTSNRSDVRTRWTERVGNAVEMAAERVMKRLDEEEEEGGERRRYEDALERARKEIAESEDVEKEEEEEETMDAPFRAQGGDVNNV